MKLVILLGIFFHQIITSVSQNDTHCIENPTGEVSLNVAVRGVPGPEGPQGPKGDTGATGEKGLKGDHGVQGEKGDHGETGPMGLRGTKGDEGRKGQQGVHGQQGKQGPPGSPGLVGPRGSRGPPGHEGHEGHEGPEGPIGPPGPAGHPGPIGPQGEPGDTVLNDEELDRVIKTVHNSIFRNVSTTVSKAINTVQQKIESLNITLLDTMMSELRAINETLNKMNFKFYSTKCGIFANWRRIAYFDTTRGDSCPTGLRTVTNTSTRQRACGRTVNGGCTSLQFSPNGTYTNVCGRVRGYQYYQPESFERESSIDSPYLHGVSITHGTPRTHLWSYVTGRSEQHISTRNRCPCAKPDSTDRFRVPSFVGEDFYCESGFSGSNAENRIAWEDPLWDGQGCYSSGNQCCNRYGWFHRVIPATSDNIELRWCADAGRTDEDVLTDQLEIWVM